MMQAILSCDSLAGTWLTAPLHILHRQSMGTSSVGRAMSNDRELDYPTPDVSYHGTEPIQTDLKMIRRASDAFADAGAADAAANAEWDWGEVRELEERLISSFVRQSCLTLTAQGSLSIALSPFAGRFLASRPITSAVVVLVGTVVVAMGCLILERADCGVKVLDIDEAPDDDMTSDTSSISSLETRNKIAEEKLGNVVMLACHFQAWRYTGFACLLTGFTSAVAPLIGTEGGEAGRPKLLSVLSLLGSGACVAGMCSAQSLVASSWVRRSNSSACGDSDGSRIDGAGEEGERACPTSLSTLQASRSGTRSLSSETSPLSLSRAGSSRDLTLFTTPDPEPLTIGQRMMMWLCAAQDAVPLQGSWMACSIVGACAVVVCGGRREGWKLGKMGLDRWLVIALKPVSLLILHSGDLRSKYRTCRLRVFCPRPMDKGASKTLTMWQYSREVLHSRALEVQLSTLQVRFSPLSAKGSCLSSAILCLLCL